MKIYQTDNIEAAIRHMSEKNRHAVVFDFQWCLRRVRTRHNLISDIPSVLVRPWDSSAAKAILNWQKEGGLMLYRHMKKFDLLPETDALMFSEIPLQYRDLEKFQGRARKEVIIYRPPDWSMHAEMVDFKFPLSDTYKRLFAALASITGKHADITRNQTLCLEYSGWPAERVAVFNAAQIVKLASLYDWQLKTLVKHFWAKGHYVRYDCYKPMVEPMEPDLLEMYRVLEAQPNIGGGLRAIRFGLLPNYVKFFAKALRIMVKTKCVAEYEPVHLVMNGWHPMEYDVIDAIAGVRRDGCLRLRQLVEDAPVY